MGVLKLAIVEVAGPSCESFNGIFSDGFMRRTMHAFVMRTTHVAR
jgi:hypothetical protein